MKHIIKILSFVFVVGLWGCQSQQIKEVEISVNMESPYVEKSDIILKHDGKNVIERVEKREYSDFPEGQDLMFYNPTINELKETQDTYNKYEGFNLEFNVDEENKVIYATLNIDYTLFPYDAYVNYTGKEGIKNHYEVNLEEELELYRSLPNCIIYD